MQKLQVSLEFKVGTIYIPSSCPAFYRNISQCLLILLRQLPDNVLETWKDGRNLSLDRLRSFGLYVVPFNGHAMFCFVIH